MDMKNILHEEPLDFADLHGRLKYSCLFVAGDDIKGKELLDIGCGFGWFELYTIKKGVKSIVGLERSEEDLHTAKAYIKHPNVSFQIGTAIDLPFKDNSFDAVVCWEVIEHLPKNTEYRMFRDICRVLKSRGRFYLSTPYASFLSITFDPAWWLIRHRHYTSRKLIKLAQETGFEVENVVLNGGWYELIGMNNMYVSKWIFRRSPFLKDFFDRKQDEEYHRSNGFANIFLKLAKRQSLIHQVRFMLNPPG